MDSLSGVGGNCLECVRLFVGGTYGGGVIVPAVDYQQPNKTSWQPSECLQLRVFGQPPVGDDITFSETGAIFAISIAIAVGSAQLPAPAGSHPAGAAPGPDAAQPAVVLIGTGASTPRIAHQTEWCQPLTPHFWDKAGLTKVVEVHQVMNNA